MLSTGEKIASLSCQLPNVNCLGVAPGFVRFRLKRVPPDDVLFSLAQ